VNANLNRTHFCLNIREIIKRIADVKKINIMLLVLFNTCIILLNFNLYACRNKL